jgi:hypothetical protein
LTKKAPEFISLLKEELERLVQKKNLEMKRPRTKWESNIADLEKDLVKKQRN